jgi:hypothetical protein
MDQASRPTGCTRMVPRWDFLHRRGLQAGDQAAHCPGCLLGGSSGLFNPSLDGSTRLSIDIREGEVLDDEVKALIQAAVAENLWFGAPKSLGGDRT